MFQTSSRALFLVKNQFLQYYLVMLYAFFINFFIVTPSPAKKFAYKTFFALKDCLEYIGRLLCLVAKILLLSFLTGSK